MTLVEATMTACDITQHQRLEQELANAQQRIRELTEREAALVEAQAIAQVGSWTWDPATETATWSDEMYRIFDRSPADGPLSHKQFAACVHPEDRQSVVTAQLTTFGAAPSAGVDYRVVTDSGEERLVRTCCRIDEQGRFVGTMQDVTQLRISERPLSHSDRAALEQLQAAFDLAPVGMGVTDTAGRIVRVNEALSWVTGYQADELRSMTAMSMVHPDDVEQVKLDCLPLESGEDAVTYAHRMEHAAGHEIWVQVCLTVLRDESGEPRYSLVQMVDVSEQKLHEDELTHMADHDPLTGLLNRRGFEAALGAHLDRCERYGTAGALLMLDLDGFKAVNDTLGHAAGDEVIKSAATALASRLRQSDVIARLGGDEFAVLLPVQNREESEAVAAALLTTIHNRAIPGPDSPGGVVTASIGIALVSGAPFSAEELLGNADIAMYASKAAGKARYTVHTPGAERTPVPSTR
jgi:diguanylate cyclase (GGDEF)-like protein/PAS domain S-box-containing protein